MSYQTQNNSQQHSAGFILVVSFHALLIWALANGLVGINIKTPTLEPLNITSVQEKQNKKPLPEPEEIVFNSNSPFTIDPIVAPTLPPIPTEAPSESGLTFKSEPTVIEPQLTATKPILKKISRPDYPIMSKRLNEEGATEMSLLINENGKVTEVNLVTTSGSDRLDEAAIKHAQRHWTFTPCTENGKPIACWFKTRFIWQLEDAMR
jgi:periplasmic protein TonB